MAEFSFTVEAKLVLENTPPEQTSKHVRTDYRLELSKNLDYTKYFMPHKYILTKEGSKVVTDVLTSALAAHIHFAHQRGHKDSAQHLREVIKKLEDQFVLVANVSEGKM